MANVRTPRAAWISAGLDALASGGPDAVRVEALAVRLGVSKGGFYWHFADRQALLDEMLDTWEQTMVDEVIERIDSQPGDGRAKLQRLFELASQYSEAFAAELAVRDWSRRDKAIFERLRRVDNRRMEYMRSLFRQFCVDEDDADARSMLAFSLFAGSYFIAARHPEKSRSQILGLAVKRLLSDTWG